MTIIGLTGFIVGWIKINANKFDFGFASIDLISIFAAPKGT